MAFSVNVSSLEAWKARIEQAIADAPTFNALAANEVGTKLVEELEFESPFDGAENNGTIPNEEGHLRESFGMNEAAAGEQSTSEIWTNEPIKFGYVTQGTASPILPVIKMALWWPDAEHPTPYVSGQMANPFHEKAKDTVESNLQEIVNPCIEAWLGDI